MSENRVPLTDLVRTIELAVRGGAVTLDPEADGISIYNGPAIVFWGLEKAEEYAPISPIWAEQALSFALQAETEQERRLGIRFINGLAQRGLIRGQVADPEIFERLIRAFEGLIERMGPEDFGKLIEALNRATYRDRLYAALVAALREIS